MKLKQRLIRGGLISNIISILSFLLFSLNLMDQIIKGQSIIGRVYMTLPFFVLGLLAMILNNKKTLTILFFISGIYLTIRQPDMGDISGAFLFMAVYKLYKKNTVGILMIAISLVCVSIRSTILQATIYSSFGLLLGFLVLYFLYFIVFCKKGLILLNKKEKSILNLMADGYSQKEAGYELGLDQSQANYLIKNIRDKNEDITLNQVLYLYGKSQS